MRTIKVLFIVLLVLVASGCTYKTKFNRGVNEIPGHVERHAERDYEKFLTLDDHLERYMDGMWENSVDGTHHVARWTKQEWNRSEDNVRWVVVQIGKEFETIRGAAAYCKRRWDAIGEDTKGLWRDTYSFMEHEIQNTGQLDDEAKRYLMHELHRMDNADKGLKRWTDRHMENWASLRRFVKRVYRDETEKGTKSLEDIKDYFTKETP
ncbi:MAG: hypothetical protein U5N86_13280 [Planctomycetota bacterium]|nr:hypothetical protein [Planctomycetota bacterium]